MTLQASGQITYNDIVNELRISNPSRAYTGTLGDADMRALAGVPSGPISFSNFYGKSSYIPMNVTGNSDYDSFNSVSSGGTASTNPSVSVTGGNPSKTYLWSFTSNPNGFTLSNSSSQTCTVSKAFTQNANFIQGCTLQCAVNDGSNTVTATGITGTLEVSNGA